MTKMKLSNPNDFMNRLNGYIQTGETINEELTSAPRKETLDRYDEWREDVGRFLNKYDDDIVAHYHDEFSGGIYLGFIGGRFDLYAEIEKAIKKIEEKLKILRELEYDFSQKYDDSITTSFAAGAIFGGAAAALITNIVGEDKAKQVIEGLKKQPRKYQIFVSSTYRELEKERSIAINAINRMGHIPRAMELFPSSCDSSWNYITRILIDCDFVLLIMGKEYGHTMPDEDGEEKSMTEMEYEFAMKNNIPVLAIKYDNDKTGITDERQQSFIAKVSSEVQRPSADFGSLGSIITHTLAELDKYNRPGWVSWKLFDNTFK